MRFLLLGMLLLAQVASAQLTLPVTFEQDPALYALTDFEGLSGTTIVVDPTNPANKVVRTVKGLTAGTSAGTTVGGSAGFAIRLPFAPGSAKMTVRVWSPDANIPVRLKVEDSRDPRISVETETRTTVAGAWETLTFNFENHATGTEAINFAARYNKASIFFNFGTSGAAAGEKTYYWDDMALEGGGAGTADLPSFPISFEETSIDWDNLFTGFGGGVLSRVANPSQTGINTSAFVARMVKGAGDPWGGAVFPMASRIDLNVSTEFRVKVWSPRAGARLLFKVENADNGAIAFEQDRTIEVANQWTELTYDFSAANRSANYGKVVLIFDLGTVGDGSPNFTFYVDDIVQGSAPPPPPPPRPVLPISFEETTIDWNTLFEGFDGGVLTRIENPDRSGINTSAHVVRMVKGAGQPWGGAFFPLATPINLNTSTEFRVKVWSPRAGAKLLFKLENEANGAIAFEQEREITVANQWTELTYDFTAANAAETYGKVVLIFDLGTMGDGSANFTFFVDDIQQGPAAPPPASLPTLPVSFEESSIDWSTVFTGFDGGDLARIANPDPTGINTSGFVARMVKGAGQPWGGAFFPLADPIDLSRSTEFTLKVWSPRAGARLTFKIENAENGAIAFEQERTIEVANAWTTLTYDLSAANRTQSYQKIVLIFDNGTTGDASANFTFFVDDIAQGTTPPPPVARPIMPISFEDSTIDWATIFTGFEGADLSRIENPDRSGINTSAHVARMVKGAGQPWAGAFFPLGQPVDLNTSSVFRVKVWSPRAGATLLFKLENEFNSAIAFEQERTITVANRWVELTFDFSAANATENYGRVVLIFDNGTLGDGSANFTYYLDDIQQGATTPEPSGLPSLPLTFEQADIEWDTIFFGFDGGVLTRVANPDRFGSNSSAFAARMVKNAGQPWAGALIPLDSRIDLAKSTEFRVRVWSPRVGAKLTFKIENPENGAIGFEQERTIGVANDWTTLTFDMSGANRTAIYQNIVLIFDNGTMGDGSANYTFYVDDIIQTDTPPPPVNAITFPVNFESEEIGWSSFFTNFDGGVASRVANPDATGLNTSAFVGRMVKGTGAVWAGSYFRMTSPIDMSNPVFRVQVWSPRANARMLFKLENDTDASQAFEVDQTVGVANAWTEMSFDMSGANPAHTYQKVVLIFDLGTAGDGSANYTFYFDNITNRTATSTEADFSANALVLEPNHPNPFRGRTQISWSVPTATDVRLAVYDLLGREVTVLQEGVVSAGSHTATFDASNLAPGMYVYRLSAAGASRTGRMTLLP